MPEALEALEQQLTAAQLAKGLTTDLWAGALCAAQMNGVAASVGHGQAPDAVVHSLQQTWKALTIALPQAVPFEWDFGASYCVEHLIAHMGPDEALSRAALPAAFGWWWWGEPSPLTMEMPPCGIAWNSHARGVTVYPFHIQRGRWRVDCLFKGQLFKLGPVCMTGMRIDFDVPWKDVCTTPPAIEPELVPLVMPYIRLFIAACKALEAGDLCTEPVRVDTRERSRLLRAFPGQRVPSEIYRVVNSSVAGVRLV